MVKKLKDVFILFIICIIGLLLGFFIKEIAYILFYSFFIIILMILEFIQFKIKIKLQNTDKKRNNPD